MVIFREHRGGLIESMETAKEFEDFESMKKYVYQIRKKLSESLGRHEAPFEVSDIVIDKTIISDDKRINWHDTMYVCVKRYGDKKYETPQCIGMCATNYEYEAGKLSTNILIPN